LLLVEPVNSLINTHLMLHSYSRLHYMTKTLDRRVSIFLSKSNLHTYIQNVCQTAD